MKNFKQIIKKEWKKEFPFIEESGQQDEPVSNAYEKSIFCTVFEPLVEKICIKVWNQAIDECLENVELEGDEGGECWWVDKQSILKLKIDEQRTNRTEV